MSIILKALKKVQDQKADDLSELLVAGPERSESLEQEPVSPSPLQTAESVLAGMGTTAAKAQGKRARTGTAIGHRRSARSYKILIGLIMVLGLFTTGWFVNRIYSNSHRAGGPVEPASRSEAQVSSSSGQAPATPQQSQPKAAEPVPAVAENNQVNVKAPVAPAISAPTGESVRPVAAFAKGPDSADSISGETERSEPGRGKGENERKPAAPASKPGGKPELKINAIAWREAEPKAIVNMQRVFVGDTIEGATVKAINRQSVVFEYKGETFEVRF